MLKREVVCIVMKYTNPNPIDRNSTDWTMSMVAELWPAAGSGLLECVAGKSNPPLFLLSSLTSRPDFLCIYFDCLAGVHEIISPVKK